MTLSTLEQFIRFGTDAAGIERVLRMVQAILMVVISQPLLTGGFFKLVDLGNQHVWAEPRVASIAALTDLRTQVALIRRFFRMFRFLESFYGAYQIYTSFYAPAPAPPPPAVPVQAAEASKGEDQGHQAASTQPATTKPPARSKQPPTEAWLDIFSRMFNGMYLLLEAVTLVDALRLPGFSLWGVYWSTLLHVEGQRFWLFALICGAASGLVKMVKLLAYAPVPQTGEGYGTGEKAASEDMADWERERARMRRMVAARKESRRMWKAQLKTTGRGLLRRCVADVLDVVVPGSVVGWVDVQPGTVGAVMVVTTWLTGVGIWERCGQEVERI